MKLKKIVVLLLSMFMVYVPFTLQSQQSVSVEAATPLKVYTLTQRAQLFNGVGEPGAAITAYFPQGQTAKTVVDKWGFFTVTVPKGAVLPAYGKVRVDQKNTKGVVTSVTKIIEEFIAAPGINGIRNGEQIVYGTGKPGQEIILSMSQYDTNGKEYFATRSTVADKSGKWSAKLARPLMNATVSVEYHYRYLTGRYVENRVFEFKSVLTAPVINPVKVGAKTIIGRAPAYSTVKLTLPNGRVYEARAGVDTRWSLNVPADLTLKPGQKIKAEIPGHISENKLRSRLLSLPTSIIVVK